ncbi:MAG: tetratricopeptide repeat protein, partial [Proteobacteria bacterium]|nr:tetratricopeptide repeat protein [Pseudomonadota bacterium]
YASAEHLLHVLNDSPEVEGAAWPRRTVGRRPAKAALREAFDQIVGGNQGVVIQVCGGPGYGKTRLLDLAEAYARRRGLPVGRGRCRPQDRPFGAFSRVYRALGAGLNYPVLEQVLGDKQDQDTLWERYPIMAAFRELLVASAPCVVILDGLERADPATVELLEYLVRNTLELVEEPIVYVVAQLQQPGEDKSHFQLAELEAVRRIDLGPLDGSEVEELILSLLDNRASSLALAERLYVESDGSPALITDMVRGMLDEGTIVPRATGRHRLVLDVGEITRSKLPMPASLRQALKERLAPLLPEVMDVARVLAVARRRVDLDTLVALTKGDEEDVMDALDELVDALIVVEEHEDEDEWFALNQARLRDVLLEDLSEDDLRGRHRRFGEVLEQKNRHQITQVVEELAYHFENGGVAAKAYTYLLLTATKYLHRSLYEESLEYIDRALKLEPSARLSLVLDIADKRLAEVLIAKSQAQFSLGRWADALDAAKEARRLAQELQEPHLISRAAAEVGLQLRNLGQIQESERELRDALKRADEAGEPALRPGPLYQLAGLVWGMGNIDEAESLWNECLEVAIQVGDKRAQGSGYNGLGILAICRGRTMEARRHLEESAALFESLGMLGPLAITRVNLVELYLATGILKKALYLAERTVAQAREVFHAHGIALGLAWRGQVLLALGRLDDAKRDAVDAIRLVRQLGTAPEDEVLTLATLVLVCLARGEPDEALKVVEELLPSLAEYDYEGIRSQVAAWHAQALAELGRKEEARRVLEARFIPEQQWPHIQVKTFLAVGIAWVRLGASGEAKAELERALQVAEANGFRYFQLLMHHLLIKLTTNEEEQARHIRVASSLSRSLAASLPRRDAEHFSKVFS